MILWLQCCLVMELLCIFRETLILKFLYTLSLYLYLSSYPSIYHLYISIFIHPSIHLYIYIYMYLCMYLFNAMHCTRRLEQSTGNAVLRIMDMLHASGHLWTWLCNLSEDWLVQTYYLVDDLLLD